jgi:hypothetical protein
MPAATTISFPDYDPVTGPPTLDGFTANRDPGFITNKTEPGFAVADSVMFAGGAVAPPVVLQCERVFSGGEGPGLLPEGDYLAMSFFVSLDFAFDDNDVIVVVLKPAGSVGRDTWRRLDIHPVFTGEGASQGGASEETDLDPGLPGDYHVRIDKAGRTVNRWKGTASGSPRWTPATPSNVYARSCSWEPKTISANVTSSVTLPTDLADTFTISVDSTAGFPQSGGLVADVSGLRRLIGYASKTATSFQGCVRPEGQGTITGGPTQFVDAAAAGWSVELLLPRTAALGGGPSQWIDLNDGFGLYVNIIRWGRIVAAGPHIHAGNHATQYIFPVPELGTTRNNITAGLGANTVIEDSWFGTGQIPALQHPPGSNLGQGVRFQNESDPSLSVGARDKNLPAGSPLGSSIQPGGGTHDNLLVAQVKNTDPVNAANDVTAEFRFANWGLPATTFPAWKPAMGALQPSVIDLSAQGGGTDSGEVTAVWDRANVPVEYGERDSQGRLIRNHQCIWVQMTTTGTSPVHFVQGGVRRNMDFAFMSELERQFEISGEGYEAAGGGDHELLLFPHIREMLIPESAPDFTRVGRREDVTYRKVWFWIVDGLRRTGKTITIEGETAEILDPGPGQFGAIALHEDDKDVLGYRISGAGIEWQNSGYLTARVPQGGRITGRAHLRAGPPDEIARWEEEPGCFGWLIERVPFLRPLIEFLRKLLRRRPG